MAQFVITIPDEKVQDLVKGLVDGTSLDGRLVNDMVNQIEDQMHPIIEEDRLPLKEEAERLLGYWERHGNNPETVSKWAVSDMLGILRYIAEED